MYSEIQDAVNFVLSHLYDKVPRRKTDLFGEQLANFILLKYQNNWDLSNPKKDSEFRALRINGRDKGYTDPIFGAAASSIGLELNEILQLLPRDLTIYVNPNEVYYRIGSNGVPSLLSNGQKVDWLFSCPTPPVSPLKLKVTSSSLNCNQLLNTSVDHNQPVFELCGPSDPQLTAGSFAMTRFGTQRMKTNPPRTNWPAFRQKSNKGHIGRYY